MFDGNTKKGEESDIQTFFFLNHHQTTKLAATTATTATSGPAMTPGLTLELPDAPFATLFPVESLMHLTVAHVLFVLQTKAKGSTSAYCTSIKMSDVSEGSSKPSKDYQPTERRAAACSEAEAASCLSGRGIADSR
jgi:hypothetical protein